jgi:hypothetical protein
MNERLTTLFATMQVGERIARHFLGVFGRYTMLDVPESVHAHLRTVKDNMLFHQKADRDARRADGKHPSKLMEGNWHLTQLIGKDGDKDDRAARDRQEWCLEVGIPLGSAAPQTSAIPGLAVAAAVVPAAAAAVAPAAAAAAAAAAAPGAVAAGGAPAAPGAAAPAAGADPGAAPAVPAPPAVPQGAKEPEAEQRVFASLEEMIEFLKVRRIFAEAPACAPLLCSRSALTLSTYSLQACVGCRLRNLFFKWTMSEKVTPTVWRGFVGEVVKAAERVRAATLRGKALPQVRANRAPGLLLREA